MTFRPLSLLTLSLLGLVSSVPVLAQKPLPPPVAAAPAGRRVVRQVANGVELVQEIVPASSVGGPLIINVVRVDPKASGVRVEAALGQDRVWGSDPTLGREIVSALAARHRAVVGINAGFFPFMGNPLGLHIQGGDLVTEPNNRAALALLPDGKAAFAVFTYAGSARTVGGATQAITGLNRKPGKNDALLLYTPRFFSATLKDAARYEAALVGVSGPLVPGTEYTGTVSVTSEGGGIPLLGDTVVLSGAGASAEFLRAQATPGAKLTFRLDVGTAARTLDIAAVRQAVAGGPRLLTDGRVTITAAEEGIGAGFVTTRHPRTAAGVTRDGTLLLVSVDGRQKALSQGVSLPELAAILLKHGAVDAVNLDGGGSTALVTRERVTNSPSSGVERPIANALLVFGETPAVGVQGPLTLTAPPARLTVGQVFAFTLTDAAGRVQTSAPSAIWGTTGGIGFVDQEGVFRALRPGKGAVGVAVGAETVSVPVIVAQTPFPAEPVVK